MTDIDKSCFQIARLTLMPELNVSRVKKVTVKRNDSFVVIEVEPDISFPGYALALNCFNNHEKIEIVIDDEIFADKE